MLKDVRKPCVAQIKPAIWNIGQKANVAVPLALVSDELKTRVLFLFTRGGTFCVRLPRDQEQRNANGKNYG